MFTDLGLRLALRGVTRYGCVPVDGHANAGAQRWRRLLFSLPALLISLAGGCDEKTSSSRQVDKDPPATVSLEPTKQADGNLLLASPTWEAWRAEFAPPPEPTIDGLGAEAYHFKGIVYERADKDAKATGIVRRGQRIAVKERVFGSGCKGGGWYSVEPYGVVCTKDGFWVSKEARDPEPGAAPTPEKRIPYTYAKVITEKAARFFEPPSAPDLRAASLAVKDPSKASENIADIMDGIYLLALRPKGAESRFRKTIRGRYVAQDDLELRPHVPMRGERLDSETTLPLAFVWGEDRPLFQASGAAKGALATVGVAQKHARFKAEGETQRAGKTYVQGPDGILVERTGVRIARLTSRPERIPPQSKWIHVHLPEQVLVAYEGDVAVRATLVSSGQEGFETPPGVYRVQHKYISVTMNGPDPDKGFYEVEEVPWTLYYFESFALHGAYWHNDFGKVRSHGCTNIPPADARWLFYWSDPEVPPGWHATTRTPGTYVYITDAEP